MNTQTRSVAVLALLCLLALPACSTLPQGEPEKKLEVADTNNDPLEGMNRVVFDVNDFLDRLLVRPLAELYRAMIPPPLRDRVANIVKTMGEPVVAVNSLLQGKFEQSGISVARLVVNATAGVGGMFEVANDIGLPPQQADFGQTLYTWGVTDGGPYLVLPFFGPSNVRDTFGMVADSEMDPWQWVAMEGGNAIRERYGYAQMAGSGIVKREQNIEGLDALREGSIDFYAQMRSIYLQYRAKQLGAPVSNETPVFEDYDTEGATK